jgi:energy-coupling factor transporter ATP-binding protein EcfA2
MLMTHPSSDTPLISWPCYEPAGHRVQISESDLVQHILLIGSTGSGKSTLLIHAAQQLVASDFRSAEDKPGVLILDAKTDDLVTRIQDAAFQAGRLDDVVLFGPACGHGLDLFGGLRNLDDVDLVTSQVMLATDKFGRDNAYWWQTSKAMLSAAFTLLVATDQVITFESTVEFLRRWFFSPVTPSAVQNLTRQLTKIGGNRHPLVAIAMDQVPLWQDLDSRTRSNLQSCLLNVLRPMMSPAAIRCLGSGGVLNFTPAQAATDGKICIVSVNAMKEPDLARFVFRLAKQTFFDAVQQRNTGHHRLCGLLADELPLIVTREDVEQLATVRSKKCFVIAATQGLHALSERIGPGEMHSLTNNFNTTVFMRSREAETSVQAFIALGTRKEQMRRQVKEEDAMAGVTLTPNAEFLTREIPVCPMGALGRLAQHQAFVTYADGRRSEAPLWFAPWFELPAETKPTPVVIRPVKTSAAHVEHLMLREGFRVLGTPQVILRAAALTKRRRRKTLLRVSEFFRHKCCQVPEGLEALPECWQAALPGILWSLRKPHWPKLPFFIKRVSVAEGLVILEFAQELPEPSNRLTAWDRIRIHVNASIYPNRWRPLSAWHKAKLSRSYPELETF